MTRIWAATLTVLLVAAVLVALPVPAAASGDEDTFGFVDPATGVWIVQERDWLFRTFYFGNPGDYPFLGDWDCDTVDTPGLYRQSDGYVYLRNSNTQGIADVSFFFGNPGDFPIAGDFNGDGCDTVSIYRPSEQRFYVINQLGTEDGGLGAADYSFIFGNPGDKPFVGDFNGNGQDTIGLHRESTGLVYFRNTNTSGIADDQFYFGDPGDRFVAGDWTGDGIDSPGLFRPSNQTVYLRYTNTQGNADEQLGGVGASHWLPIAGWYSLCGDQSSIPTSECKALVSLFDSTAGYAWYNTNGWYWDTDPCSWYGVTCAGGSVTELDLGFNNLSGPIPPELGNLTNLTRLILPLNNLAGPIPPELGKLTNLNELFLHASELSGAIPPELGNLNGLSILLLYQNELTGTIPAEFGTLANLTDLILFENRLSGEIPGQLTNLTNLENLLLRGQIGCLTAATQPLAAWLASFDREWNDGCPR